MVYCDTVFTMDKLVIPQKSLARFWAKVDKNSSDMGCWLWTGAKTRQGYGQVEVQRVRHFSHKLSYMMLKGNVPEGYSVDHKYVSEGCPRNCVNPEHLRILTHQQNSENRKGANKGSFSGYRGVSLMKRIARWRVQVISGGVRYGTRTYPIYELHIAAYYARELRNKVHTYNEMDK